MPKAITGFTNERAAAQHKLERQLLKLPSSKIFRTHLKNLTSEPHPFGSETNVRVGEYIAQSMKKSGLHVERFPYDVYVPEPGGEVYIALVTPIRQPLNNQEYILKEDPYSGHPDLTPGWNAYAGSGDVTAKIVYVNYGTREDFDHLRKLGISVKGKIVLARFGGNFRGYKVKYAEQHGAIGVLMYSDPTDGGYASGPVYPEGKQLNESAVQRGSLLTLGYVGDPLTPFEPAYPEDSGKPVHRLNPEDLPFHGIPAAPLPYGSAIEIFKRMQGKGVPAGWQGGLPCAYRLTGGPDLTVRLRVNQPRKLTRATNVIGTLKGTEFPDEWILLGCHYDAWAFGTVDPNSGTAMLLSLADTLGKLAKDGYRPRRSIKIGHWDAEEYGIIGSTEWVEQFRDELTSKAVAYINADMAAGGPTFAASASPSLKGPIQEATKSVAYPGSKTTVYDHWRKDAPAPTTGNLGGGSDHIAFYMHAGIPSAGMTMGGFSPYHTIYDNLAWYERFADPNYVYGPAITRVNGILATRLANADLLPYDLPRYATDLVTHIDGLKQRARQLKKSLRVDALETAAASLAEAAGEFETARNQCLESNPPSKTQTKKLNAALIALEKAFLHPEGLQERPWNRSLYTAEDPFSGYASWMLPGLRYELETGTLKGLQTWQTIYVNAVETLTQQIHELTEKLHG